MRLYCFDDMTNSGFIQQIFAALILAAGAGVRLGRFKPLAELGGVPIVEHAIRLFQSVGVSDIIVVAGHRADELAPVATSLDVQVAVNQEYQRGMFSSIITGLNALPPNTAGFFLLPVDIPLVRPATLCRLIDHFTQNSPAVCYPTFQGERGHPPLISGELRKSILKWPEKGGLRDFLEKFEDQALEIPVADAGILYDMDTPQAHKWMQARFGHLSVPTIEECEALMTDVMKVPEPIRNHCRAVARVAAYLTDALNRTALNKSDCIIDPTLVQAAALVHDVARTAPNHAQQGATLLRNMGFPDVADAVAAHTDLVLEKDASIGPREILFLSDKLVSGTRLVPSLAKRFQSSMDRFGSDPAARKAIQRRRQTAERIRDAIEAITGQTLSDMLPEMP